MTSSSADDTYCNENICCIEDFMSEKKCSLPAVVRVTPSDYEVTDNDEDIPTDIEFLLSKLEDIKLVRVKVLRFDKEDQVIAYKGIEFARRRSELVGREFFLPAEYQGCVRCIPRPGSRKLFTTIKEVLEDMPRYIKFNTESPSCNTSGKLNDGQKVASGSVLILSKISIFKDSAFRFLTCSIGNNHFLFREDQKVNIEAIDDGQLHTFSELSCLPVLPLFIQLGYVSPTEIVCDNDNDAESLLIVLSGPLEVTQFVKSTMLLAWTSNGKNETCKKVLLLRKTARDRSVVLHASFSDDDAKDYIQKHFRYFNKTEWLRKSMYALNADKFNTERFICLKRPLPSDECDDDESSKTRSHRSESIQNPKPVASVKPRVATKPDGVAAKQEIITPLSPGKSILPETPEIDAKWVEWTRKIKVIHKELVLFLRKDARNSGQDYLNWVPEKQNESEEQVIGITNVNLTEPKEDGKPKRKTPSSSGTNTFNLSNNQTLMNSSPLIGQSQDTKTPLPSTHLKSMNNENQDANQQVKTAQQGSLQTCPPSASLTPKELITNTDAGDAITVSVVQPLTSPIQKRPHNESDAYVKVKDNNSSLELHLTTSTNQQSRNNSHELSQTSLSKKGKCTLNKTVISKLGDQTDEHPPLPPKPNKSISNMASKYIIDVTTLSVNKDNNNKPNTPPKPSAKPKMTNRDKNNDFQSSAIHLDDHGEITCDTPSLPLSPHILSDESLTDTSQISLLSKQKYPDKTDGTSVSNPENQKRPENIVSMGITKSPSESSLYTNMVSPHPIFTSNTPPITMKPKILPKPRNDGYEEMIKFDNEIFVLKVKSGLNSSGSNSKYTPFVQPKSFAQRDDGNSVPIVTDRKNTSSYENVSIPPILPSLHNSKLEHLDNKDDYEEIMDPLNALADNDVHQENKAEFAKGYVDVTKVMRAGQTKEHFYDYSVLDVHECFKMCFPENLEISNLILKYRLDGSFFRDDGIESFCESASIGGIQKKKLMKIINDGWRPKL
ncbi:uncharacterized protein LOC127878456 [Dreissena polymorpha]|uniref:CABIT domain-containing protein n=1 Tax=Dreissena polymorpha TaxID=45954 RepID=A0A9D4MQD6_DREPO|nr:uncharacterized protein LOC127878456 [Dreissena polymorpha]KAH3880551.1 hypothetical protein DPMN_004467 [Dreissena polymorpha]